MLASADSVRLFLREIRRKTFALKENANSSLGELAKAILNAAILATDALTRQFILLVFMRTVWQKMRAKL